MNMLSLAKFSENYIKVVNIVKVI